MSENRDEPAGITDEDLPEELRPDDDNPLAKPLGEGADTKSPEELDVLGGKEPEPDPEHEHERDEDDAASQEG